MKNVNVKNFIMTIEKMIDPEVCDFIVEAMKDKSPSFKNQTTIVNRAERQDIQRDGNLYTQYLTGIQLQRDLNFGCDFDELMAKILKEAFNIYTEAFVNALSGVAKNSLVEFSEFKFQETPIGGGFHNWHFENAGFKSSRRLLVWSIFLNDVEEGGELEFLYYPFRAKPKKGDMILFPPYYTHLHRGNPPISNTKYIATGWFYTFPIPSL